MKIPDQAPTLHQLFQTLGSRPDRGLDKLYAASPGTTATFHGKYLHWDELRRRETPPGLSREEWWLLVKLARVSPRTTIPLLSKDGQPFTYVSVDPIPASLHEIDLRSGGHIHMPEQVTNRHTRDQYYVSSLIEEAITSSQLEGATTTRGVAKEMLKSARAPRDRSERMILNNFLTMKKIGELRHEPLTKDLILEIHRLVTEDTLDDPSAAGRFRTEEESIIVGERFSDVVYHEPPPAGALPERMERLCQFANANADATGPFIHPAIRAIILHFILAYDHPFVDGNGRTARALFYWAMLNRGYWLYEFMSISHIILKAPTKYGRAFLLTETDENDLTYFILYHLSVNHRAVEALHDYIRRRTEEIRDLEAELGGIDRLNHRQRDFIRNAIRHPGRRYTIEGHRASHNVAYETARADLLELAFLGVLIGGEKIGRKLVFHSPSDVRNRLAVLGRHGSEPDN